MLRTDCQELTNPEQYPEWLNHVGIPNSTNGDLEHVMNNNRALEERWRTQKPPQFSFIMPDTGEAAKGESSSWELIPVCMTDLTERALAFTTTGPFGSSEDGWTEVRSDWWGYLVCWCGCGTQDDCAWKLMWKNESLATSPTQQMTLTAPGQGRVHKQIRRSRAAPSPAAATFTYTGWDLICLWPDLLQLCFQWLRSHKPMPTAWMPAEELSCWGSTWEDLF